MFFVVTDKHNQWRARSFQSVPLRQYRCGEVSRAELWTESWWLLSGLRLHRQRLWWWGVGSGLGRSTSRYTCDFIFLHYRLAKSDVLIYWFSCVKWNTCYDSFLILLWLSCVKWISCNDLLWFNDSLEFIKSVVMILLCLKNQQFWFNSVSAVFNESVVWIDVCVF